MRTIYLGTSHFAGAVLRRLSDSPHKPKLVISRPDSPQGRGRRLTAPPAVVVARELGLDVYQPASVNTDEASERIASMRPDVLTVCAFGALIREPLLDAYPILNVHPSLLPRWRGAAPIERAILAGDAITGVSIMQLTAGLDSGPIGLQAPEAIAPDDDYGTLSTRLERIGGELLVQALDSAPQWTAQDERGATYAEKLTPEDRQLDPTAPAADLERRVRALSPHIGAFVELGDGTRLGVWKAVVLDPVPAPPTGDSGGGTVPGPGTVLLDGEYPVLLTAQGALELREVQPAGRNRMDGAAYLRGLRR